ncbi:MAG: RNA polymerase sigma factor [Lachnospiraceae bacterium]|nr:RNA polymerase sigma factor [Ruminococcus sp.]MCM1276625.1 RNA polymerase sigma factor [Lachnospiraceae bacterium]
MMISAALANLETEEQRNTLNRFYLDHRQMLYNIAMSKLHNYEDAEDALQETFLKISDKPDLFFKSTPKERVFIVSAMVGNISINMWKKKHKVNFEELTDDIPDSGLPITEQTVGEVSRDELMKFIANLSEALREALYLKIHYGLSTSEIAEALDISNAAARKRISNAEKAVKKYLDGKQNA